MGNGGGKYKTSCMAKILDGDGTNEEDWRHSKGSASPSATNDSWRAPDSISNISKLAAWGSSADVLHAHPRLRVGQESVRRTEWTGATPTVNRRVARPRPLDSTKRHFPLKAPSTPPNLAVRDIGQQYSGTRGRSVVGDTPKGRPVRPYDSWRTPTPFLTGKLWKAAFALHRRPKTTWKAPELYQEK